VVLQFEIVWSSMHLADLSGLPSVALPHPLYRTNVVRNSLQSMVVRGYCLGVGT
jgi:hypothetical protein